MKNLINTKGTNAKDILKPMLLTFMFMFVSLSVLMSSLTSSYSLPSPLYGSSNMTDFINEINFSKVISDVKFFSSLGSRVLGYPGYFKAKQYIIDEFEKSGLDLWVQKYETAIPIEENSWIYIGSPYNLNISAHALWPNGGIVASVLRNFTGNLYYVKEGNLDGDLDKINLTNSILLMDFNSGKNWLKVASLGAKAVIFIEPPESDKYEALSKGTMSPLNFPRVYVNSSAGVLLKKIADQHVPVILNTEMKWRETEGHNIIGVLEGQLKNDTIIISAHFDSWSIVPSVSPSAEESISISVLLELARCFSRHERLRTIWFVAYSGHWEGSIGSTEFVEHVLLNSTKRVWTQIGIDLSSETPQVDFLSLSPYLISLGQNAPGGSFAKSPQYSLRFYWIRSQVSELLSEIDISKIKKENASIRVSDLLSLTKFNFDIGLSGTWAWGWWGTQPTYYKLDTESSLAVNAIAFTIRTQFAGRTSWLTPLDNFNTIKWGNVIPQIWIVSATCNYFVNAPSLGVDWSSVAPTRIYVGTQYILGYSILEGQTAEFSPDTGWYSPVPKALVRMITYPSNDEYAWPFVYRYKISDEKGKFRFYGIVPYAQWTFDAWKFDENTGDILYSLDQGFHGLTQGVSGGLTNIAYALTDRVSVLLPMFECVPVTIFDLIDIRKMRETAISDARPPYHLFFGETARLEVFEATSKSLPIFYYTIFSPDGVGVVCVKNGTRISITFNPNVAMLSRPLLVLTNSTNDNPEGHGYLVDKPLILVNTVYHAARDIYLATIARYGNLRKFQVRSLYAEDMIQKADSLLKEAENCYANLTWSKAYVNSVLALSYISKAYSAAVMPLYNEASTSIIFFTFLILPFSILFEKMFFKQTGVKKFIMLSVVIVSLLTIFTAVHPAFTVLANVPMAIVGVGILIMSIFISTIFLTEIRSMLTEVSMRLLGYHEFKTERLSAVLHTVTSAVENMRSRKLQVSLLFITIMTFTAALTSLTSTSYTYIITSQKREAEPLFTGIVIKSLYGYPPETRGGVLDKHLIDAIKVMVDKDFVVSPRIWLYPTFIQPEGLIVEVMTADGKIKDLHPGVILGLSSEETEQILTGYVKPPGICLFFGKYQALVPSSVADSLNLKMGDKIYIRGFDATLTYIGGFSISTVLSDLDQYYWIPIDPSFELDLGLIPPIYPPGAEPWSVSTENLLIIPWETAYKMGGFVSSVSLIPKGDISLDEMKKIATLISENFDVQVYVSYKNEIFTFYRLFSYTLLGWETTSILLTIASLSIANFMMGTIISRRKEIFTYASVGLSPMGAIFMFLTEGVTVSFGGTIFGYLIGFGLNRIFLEAGILPSYFVSNFAALSIIISMLVIIFSVLVSSLYPSYLAAKMITPSLERRWKIDIKPIGDVWEIPLPVRMEEKELLAMLNYLKEYYTGAGSQRPSFRVDDVVMDLKDEFLLVNILLTPIETGISQEVCFRIKSIDHEYTLRMTITRKTGDPKLWRSRNYSFIDDVRKQALLWRSLSASERYKYSVLK